MTGRAVRIGAPGNARDRATSRIAYLDGVRGLAILGVLAVHWGSPLSQAIFGHPHRITLFAGGYVGVDVFFVLSGFIITRLLRQSTMSYGSFIARRVRRLYPALIGVVLVGGVIAMTLHNDEGLRPSSVLGWSVAALLQLGSPLLAQGFALGFLGVTWSLAIEWYFYLIWGAVVRMSRGATDLRFAQFSLAVASLFYIPTLLLSARWFYFGPTARVSELLVGGALAVLLRRDSRVPRWFPVVTTTLLIALTTWVIGGPQEFSPLYRYIGFPLAVATAASLIVVGNAPRRSSIVALLEWRPLTALGLISYSLYLWHLVPRFLMTASDLPLSPPIIGLANVPVSFALALASWTLFERRTTNRRSGLRARDSVLSADR